MEGIGADIWQALTGGTSFTAHPHLQTATAGQQAINMQLQRAGAMNAAQQYSLAAGSRGANQGLAIREAQRRAQLGMGQAGEQAAQSSLQLQQAVAQGNQQAAMQAEQLNAQIAQQNAQGLGRLAGAAVMGGALALSDENAKVLASPTPGMGAPRVLWTSPGMAAPITQQQAAYQAINDERLAARNAELAQIQAAPSYRTPVASSQAPYMPQGPTTMQRFAGGFSDYYVSDARAKELESENATLKAHLARAANVARTGAGLVLPGGTAALDYAQSYVPAPTLQHLSTPDIARAQVHDQASADRYGAQVLEARRMAVIQDLERQRQEQVQSDLAQQKLNEAQARSAQLEAGTGYQQQVSDERAKMGGHMDHLQFPAGVKPVAFHYKPGMGDGPDQHYGVLAQDLEKSKEGMTTVREEPESGMKMVDIPRLTTLNTAKLAEIEHRLKKAGV